MSPVVTHFRLGVTATRVGMTTEQWMQMEAQMLQRFVGDNHPNEFHDGDCIGGDDQAFKSVMRLKTAKTYEIETHGHPCNLHQKWRANNEHDVTHPIYPPLVRNRHIVNSVDWLLCAPQEYDEVMRGSGTWATIRYAHHTYTPHTIIWPDGQFEHRIPTRTLLDA